MTLDFDENIIALANEVLMNSQTPYTVDQLLEIPRIMNAKNKYFWCVDNQLWDMMPDVFTKEGFETYWNGTPGYTERQAQVDQNAYTCNASMVPMHMGHNMIVYFTGPKSARLLTKLNDRHTYIADDAVYEGFGMYVDDLELCDDNVWRIKVLRLSYRVVLGELRFD